MYEVRTFYYVHSSCFADEMAEIAEKAEKMDFVGWTETDDRAHAEEWFGYACESCKAYKFYGREFARDWAVLYDGDAAVKIFRGGREE